MEDYEEYLENEEECEVQEFEEFDPDFKFEYAHESITNRNSQFKRIYSDVK